jgi:hypothetical protein
MILDNIIIFLNVLEQFAIRVTIFDVTVEDIIKYVNKLYFNDDDLIKKLLTNNVSNENIKLIIDPELVVKDSLKKIDVEILNENVNFEKLKFSSVHSKGYNKFIF